MSFSKKEKKTTHDIEKHKKCLTSVPSLDFSFYFLPLCFASLHLSGTGYDASFHPDLRDNRARLDFNSGLKRVVSLVSVGPPAASAPAGAPWWPVHGAARVLDGLVHGQDEAGSLGRGRQGVDAHDGRLPDAGGEVVGDVLVVDVHAVPHAALQPRRKRGERKRS